MKKRQRLALLLGVLIAVSALTFAVMKREEHKEIIKNTPATVLEMKDIDSISWDYDGSSYGDMACRSPMSADRAFMTMSLLAPEE